jgi:hypothetical protein
VKTLFKPVRIKQLKGGGRLSCLEGNFGFIFFRLEQSEFSENMKVNFHVMGTLRENNKVRV